MFLIHRTRSVSPFTLLVHQEIQVLQVLLELTVGLRTGKRVAYLIEPLRRFQTHLDEAEFGCRRMTNLGIFRCQLQLQQSGLRRLQSVLVEVCQLAVVRHLGGVRRLANLRAGRQVLSPAAPRRGLVLANRNEIRYRAIEVQRIKLRRRNLVGAVLTQRRAPARLLSRRDGSRLGTVGEDGVLPAHPLQQLGALGAPGLQAALQRISRRRVGRVRAVELIVSLDPIIPLRFDYAVLRHLYLGAGGDAWASSRAFSHRSMGRAATLASRCAQYAASSSGESSGGLYASFSVLLSLAPRDSGTPPPAPRGSTRSARPKAPCAKSAGFSVDLRERRHRAHSQGRMPRRNDRNTAGKSSRHKTATTNLPRLFIRESSRFFVSIPAPAAVGEDVDSPLLHVRRPGLARGDPDRTHESGSCRAKSPCPSYC